MNTFKIAVSRYQLQHKIPPMDSFWPKFNSSFENMEINPRALATMVYNGRSITTQHKNNWRISENYLLGQHIGLDFDAGDITSSLPHLLKDKFISKYASFLYTTMSHTEDHPRARVIFLLDTPIMQAKNYTMGAAALLWLFGTADRQCKDAVRFFYGAPGCKIEMLNNILPLAVLRKLIINYLETGILEKRKAATKDYHAPASQQEVAEALGFIPPWQINYDEWVSVLMGIHSQFGEGGYLLAESWADGKRGEVEQKWKSFDANGNTEGAVTIATVFGLAKRFGWRKL